MTELARDTVEPLNTDFLDIEDFRKSAESGESIGNTGVRMGVVPVEVKEPDDAEEERVLRFIISTGDVDRDRDTINPEGWELERFQENPVVLFGHNYRQPPIARALKVWVEDGKLMADAQFADAETYQFADTIYRLYKGKFMRATSVGFMPKKWAFSEDEDRPIGIDFEEQELLEFSAVPVPSNPHALEQAKAKGIDAAAIKRWADDVLSEPESKGGLWIPRRYIEQFEDKESEAEPENEPAEELDADSGEPEEQASEPKTEPTEEPEEEHDIPVSEETIAERFVNNLTVLRARKSGVSLSWTRSETNDQLQREANFLAAKLMPDLDSATFCELFPEVLGTREPAGEQDVLADLDTDEVREMFSEVFAEEVRRVRGELMN